LTELNRRPILPVDPSGHPAHEIEVLEQVLGKLSVMHMSKNVKKNQVPFNLPQIDPNIVSIPWGRGYPACKP